jgi:N-succinyldiaminopimelate aminotransferase
VGNVVFDSCGTSIFEEMSRLAAQVDAVNLGQGFPEGLEPKEVVEAAMRALREGPHQYPPMLGLPTLRQAVAENTRRFLGLEIDWEREVLVTSGATEALADAFFGLLNANDEVILIEPAYDSYPVIVRRAGAVPVPVRLRPPKWELPRDELKAAITPRTKAIVINTPMNPIGKIFDDDDLRFVAELLVKHDLVAIADEVYEHLVFDGQGHKTLFALPEVRDRVVRIGSAGKTFSVTGWKVGYVTADARLIAPIARAHQFVTFTTPPALQSAAAFGLRLPDAYFLGLQTALQERRDFLVDGLRGIGFDVGDIGATYFAVAGASRFDIAGDDAAFCRRLTLEAGVTAVPISAFYGGRDVRSHIRFCFAKKRETLEAALERLARWSERAGLRAAS